MFCKERVLRKNNALEPGTFEDFLYVAYKGNANAFLFEQLVYFLQIPAEQDTGEGKCAGDISRWTDQTNHPQSVGRGEQSFLHTTLERNSKPNSGYKGAKIDLSNVAADI